MLSHLLSRRSDIVGTSQISAMVPVQRGLSFKDLKNNKWTSLRMRQASVSDHAVIVQLVKEVSRHSMWIWSESQTVYIRINLISNLIWEEELEDKVPIRPFLNSSRLIRSLLRQYMVTWATKQQCKRLQRISRAQLNRNSSRSLQIHRTK